MSTVLMCFIYVTVAGQSISDNINQIEGNWVGTITYTDYSDDIKQSTLACQLKIIWKDKKGVFSLGFTEPNGKIVYDKTKVKVMSKQKRMKFEGNMYDVQSFKVDDKTDHWTLMLVREGKDNRKPALICQSITYEKDQLSLIKKIQYKDSNVTIIRNKYYFERE